MGYRQRQRRVLLLHQIITYLLFFILFFSLLNNGKKSWSACVFRIDSRMRYSKLVENDQVLIFTTSILPARIYIFISMGLSIYNIYSIKTTKQHVEKVVESENNCVWKSHKNKLRTLVKMEPTPVHMATARENVAFFLRFLFTVLVLLTREPIHPVSDFGNNGMNKCVVNRREPRVLALLAPMRVLLFSTHTCCYAAKPFTAIIIANHNNLLQYWCWDDKRWMLCEHFAYWLFSCVEKMPIGQHYRAHRL